MSLCFSLVHRRAIFQIKVKAGFVCSSAGPSHTTTRNAQAKMCFIISILARPWFSRVWVIQVSILLSVSRELSQLPIRLSSILTTSFDVQEVRSCPDIIMLVVPKEITWDIVFLAATWIMSGRSRSDNVWAFCLRMPLGYK